jgi:hypothetical protein
VNKNFEEAVIHVVASAKIMALFAQRSVEVRYLEGAAKSQGRMRNE